MLGQLKSHNENDDKNEEEDADSSESESGHDQANTILGTASDDAIYLAEVRSAQNICHTLSTLNKESQQNETGSNENLGMINSPMLFLKPTMRLKYHTYLHAQSLAFFTLFLSRKKRCDWTK